jgi:hypothetical protein
VVVLKELNMSYNLIQPGVHLNRFGVVVLTMTAREVWENIDQIRIIVMSGGAMASNIGKIAAEERGVAEGIHINIYEEMMTEHTEEEREAILQHELGHVKHNHIDKTEYPTDAQPFFIENLEYELEADEYAVGKTSKIAMRSALLKSVKAVGVFGSSVNAILGLPPLDEVALAKFALENLAFQTRLKALA